MGLFGFVKKGLGHIARFGASKVTMGLSEKVLSKLKSAGKAKAMAKAIAARTAATNQQAVAALKLAPTAIYGDSLRRARSKRIRRDLMEAPIPVEAIIEPARKAPARKAPARRKAASVRKAPARRVAPKGGLDLAKIGQMWRAAGKPGDWRGFVSDNTHVRKK